MELHLQYVVLEASSVARFAFQHQVGHELHLHRYRSFALAFLTASPFGVEAEEARGVAHLLGQGLVGIEFAYLVPSFDVGHRIRTGGFPDGVLVDELNVPQLLHVALKREVFARSVGRFVEVSFHGQVQDVAHKRRLSAAAHSCHTGHHVQRELHIDSLQVVGPSTFYLYEVVPWASVLGHRQGVLAREILERPRVRLFL